MVSSTSMKTHWNSHSQKQQVPSLKLNQFSQFHQHPSLSEPVYAGSGSSLPSPECKTDHHHEHNQIAEQSPTFPTLSSLNKVKKKKNEAKYGMSKEKKKKTRSRLKNLVFYSFSNEGRRKQRKFRSGSCSLRY